MNVNFIGFYIDGKSHPGNPLTPDYKTKSYVEAYHTLFSGSGRTTSISGNGISREHFADGYCVYIFDIASNHDTDCTTLSKTGHTRVNIQFSEALNQPVTFLMYAQFPATLEIDHARNVMIK